MTKKKSTEKVKVKRGVGAPKRNRWPFHTIENEHDVLEIENPSAAVATIRSAASRAGKELGRRFSVSVERDDAGKVTLVKVFLST